MSVNPDYNVARCRHKGGVPRKRLILLGTLNNSHVSETVVGVFKTLHFCACCVGGHTVNEYNFNQLVGIILKLKIP